MLSAAGTVLLAAAGCSSPGPTTASRFGPPSAATNITLTDPSGVAVNSVAFSPDGRTIATGDRNGSAYLWDAARHTLIATLTNPAGQVVDSMAFSPDGRTIATGGGNGGSAYLWDVSGHTLIATLTDPSGPNGVYTLAFSPDGSTIATGDSDGSTYLWDAARHTVTATLTTAQLADQSGITVNAVAFSPDGKTIATGDNEGNIYLWDAARHTLTTTMTDPGGLTVDTVAFSPDGRTIATGDSTSSGAVGRRRGKTLLWDASRHTLTATLAGPPDMDVRSVAFSPDGTVIATGNNNGLGHLGRGEGNTYLWDADRHTQIATLPDPSSQGIDAVAFGPDGSSIATGAGNATARLWRPGGSR